MKDVIPRQDAGAPGRRLPIRRGEGARGPERGDVSGSKVHMSMNPTDF